MNPIGHIFDLFGGPTAVGVVLGVNPSTASEMKRRRSIPVRYWPRLVESARERGLEIDNNVLVAAHVPATERVA